MLGTQWRGAQAECSTAKLSFQGAQPAGVLHKTTYTPLQKRSGRAGLEKFLRPEVYLKSSVALS